MPSHVGGGTSYLCFMVVFVMQSYVFLAAMWLSCVLCFLVFLSLFHYGVSDQVRYLKVSIPDFCRILNIVAMIAFSMHNKDADHTRQTSRAI